MPSRSKRSRSADISADLGLTVSNDGIHFRDRVILVALGIDAKGNKHVLGLREGSTEASRVVRSLLSDLVDRGLDADRARVWVIDGGKALRKAIRNTFGQRVLVQRCQEHKRRNVLAQLPKKLHPSVNKTLRDAYRSPSKAVAKRRLLQLVSRFESEYTGAAASLKEGLDETLTLKDLGLSEALERTLSTTNPIENLNGTIRRIQRRVRRWRDASMVRRWVAIGVLEAQRGFRKLRGHKSMAKLVDALRALENTNSVDAAEVAA